jgi:hypothetical protein
MDPIISEKRFFAKFDGTCSALLRVTGPRQSVGPDLIAGTREGGEAV